MNVGTACRLHQAAVHAIRVYNALGSSVVTLWQYFRISVLQNLMVLQGMQVQLMYDLLQVHFAWMLDCQLQLPAGVLC